MSTTQPDDTQQHWRELAEQLGLEPEPSSTPPTAANGQSPSPPLSQPGVSSLTQQALPAASQVSSAEIGSRSARAAPQQPEPELVFGEGILTKVEIGQTEVEETVGATLGDERPRLGRRRRGRRRSKGKKARQGLPAVESTVPGQALSDQKQPEHPDRQEPEYEDEDGPEASGDVEETAEGPSMADLSGEEDYDFSNWNVPSWNELVDSLYRPDR